ncbi:hypothetical protein ABBQ38_006033 [Trebouxia sp. C0009 RCD-2024]
MGRTQARKRTRSTRISCVPSAVTDGTVHGPPCSATQLWHSHISVPVSDTFSENLAIATKAFHAQIEALSKKPPQLRQAGFSQLANKQRLEFRAGDTALGQLGLLQGLAITVVQAFDDIARGILESLAKSLQLPADAFQPILDQTAVDSGKQSASSLEAIHYMMPEGVATSLGAPACEAHEDKGLLTLIYSDTAQGLHVEEPDGRWTHLLLPQGHIAVLAGQTLERAVCGLIKAAKHRVLVGAPGGCPTPRNALVYKLRAPETAVLDLYTALNQHHQHAIPPRFRSPIGVGELMHYFDAMHTSVNSPPAKGNEQQDTATQNKKVKTETQGVPMALLVQAVAMDGRRLAVATDSKTPLQKVFDTYNLRFSLSSLDGKFFESGQQIIGTDTPEFYGLQSGDVIDWFGTQRGD